MVYSLQSVFQKIKRSLVSTVSPAAILFACLGSSAQDWQPTEAVPPSPSGGVSSPQPTQVSKIDELWMDKPLATLRASIEPTEGELPPKVPLTQLLEQYRSMGIDRRWYITDCDWDAPLTMNLPLMFEEPNLERMGYTYRYCCNDLCEQSDQVYASECIQPLISGVHFFGRIPLIPYMLHQQPLCEPIYTLGVDRPGSPVCYRSYNLLNCESVLRQTGRTHEGIRARIHSHDQSLFGWMTNYHLNFGDEFERAPSCEPRD